MPHLLKDSSIDLEHCLPWTVYSTIETLANETADRLTIRLASVISSDSSRNVSQLEAAQFRLDALSAFQAKVDLRVQGLQRQAKKQWNSLQPIHRLPTEVFVRILLHTRENRYQPLPFHTIKPTENCDLALVSTQWRDVIFDTPAFWPSIDFEHPEELQKIILRRNAHATISVRCDREELDIPREDIERFMGHFEANPRRVESLNFGGHLDMSSWDVILPFLPTVKDLVVDDCGGESHVQRFRFLIPGDTPLRHVVIQSMSLDWSSTRLTQLHSLCLWGIPILPSNTRLHALLSASPQLELLMLEYHTDQDEEPEKTLPMSPIHLSELTSLVILSIPTSISDYILSKIAAPRCERVICRTISVDTIIKTPSPFQTLVQDVFKLINDEDEGLKLSLEELTGEEDDGSLYFTLENDSVDHQRMEWYNFRYMERDAEIFIGAAFTITEWDQLFQVFEPIVEKISTLKLGGLPRLFSDFTSMHISPFDSGCLALLSAWPVRRLAFTGIAHFKPILPYISEPRTLPDGTFSLPFPQLDTVSLLISSTPTKEDVDAFLNPLIQRNIDASFWGLGRVTRIRVSKQIERYLYNNPRASSFVIEYSNNPWDSD